jgi:cation:H+ antiporter
VSGQVAGPVAVFVPAAAASLAASALLVRRLERLSTRLDIPEALLGLIVALAADTPEVTSAVAALAGGQGEVGAGVVLGSNAFNLAALLGLGAIAAGRIALHRRVILLEGAVALWMAAVAIAAVAGALPPAAALLLACVMLVPYVAVSAVHPARRLVLPFPRRIRDWLATAVSEEERELTPPRRARGGSLADAGTAVISLAVVLAASIVMERSATRFGSALAIPGIITGGLVLAAVTSLPNAVSAVYLAVRGRASATLATALNSNTLNVLAGLLVPAVITGIGQESAHTAVLAVWYGGLTAVTLALALRFRGLGRRSGFLIVGLYAALVAVLLAA